MAKLNRQQIQDAAYKLLADAHSGMRWMDILRTIKANSPETPLATIAGGVKSLLSINGNVLKPSRGVWILREYHNGTDGSPETDATATVEIASGGRKVSIREDQFYESFAEWLRDNAEEVTESMALGGRGFKSKWGTPDVIGVYKPKSSDIIKFEIEIVSAEIKVDPSQSVVAFGQVCAYRLFSHKTIIAMPRQISPEDQDRLDALCSIYGVGLVLFELDPERPDFHYVVRPQRFQPDSFYVNEFARRLQEISRADFDRLL